MGGIIETPCAGNLGLSDLEDKISCLSSPARFVLPTRPELILTDSNIRSAPIKLADRISTPREQHERYLSNVRTYNGMLGEILSNLGDFYSKRCTSTKVQESIDKFKERAKTEFEKLEQILENRSLFHLLDYQMHADLLSVFERPRLAHESPKDRGIKLIIELSSQLFKQASLVLDERVFLKVNIREIPTYRVSPHSSELEKLVDINKRLLIDAEKSEPQVGFGRVLEQEELQKILSAKGARLFLLEHKGAIAGYYILHTSLDNVSPQVAKALQRPLLMGASNGTRCGWADIVGILPEARREIEARSAGVKAYDLLDTAVVQSARAHNIETLFGEVREGTQCNLAKASHLRRGWEETGVIYSGARFPYQILERSL